MLPVNDICHDAAMPCLPIVFVIRLVSMACLRCLLMRTTRTFDAYDDAGLFITPATLINLGV